MGSCDDSHVNAHTSRSPPLPKDVLLESPYPYHIVQTHDLTPSQKRVVKDVRHTVDKELLFYSAPLMVVGDSLL
uniref:Uncharacterized protein n=1 Tax=Steinernema glaseri TaxID=37863 RepID=A0A1I7Y5H9_9BILA